jgi:N-sulfoglucosamine sulfohydrolase
MNNTHFLVLGLLGAYWPLSRGQSRETSANLKIRPNIILITGDDLGTQIGCYGDKFARTPAIDRMAMEGVRFNTTWVTASSSSPSRSSIFTSLYPHQNGQIGLSHLGFQSKETPRLPNLLKSAGYRTGILGKLHVAPESGFQFDMEMKDNWTIDVQRVVREAKLFIEEDTVKPFFLKISYFDPHEPNIDQILGSPAAVYKEGDVQAMGWVRGNKEVADKMAAHYYNAVARVDDGISRLMEYLKQSGMIKNTVILFVGDNGAAFNGGKTTCYEPGMSVPFIVYWKGGLLKAGQVRNELVSTIDIMPTILEICGVKIPEGLEGRSLIPQLKGQEFVEWRTFLFGEMNFHQPSNYNPMRTIRDSRYHLIQNLYAQDKPEWELYDLFTDPLERENIVGNPINAIQLNRLKIELNKWRVDTRDPLLDPATDKKWRELSQSVKGNDKIPPIMLIK